MQCEYIATVRVRSPVPERSLLRIPPANTHYADLSPERFTLLQGVHLMNKKLYVGNLPYSTTDRDLRALFEQAGEVTEATVITDRETGRSKGFGFVEMNTPE